MTQINELNQLYVRMIMSIIQNGERVNPRGKPTREVVGGVVTLKNPHANIIQIPERKLNYHFMVAEALWMMLGRNDVSMLRHYNKNIEQFSDDGKTFAGAYGPRIKAQLPRVIRTLVDDPTSRQAVISIWDREPAAGSKDVPCTVCLQFLIRGGPPSLCLLVYMRSSDVWWGVPYDIFNFTTIQNALAAELELPPGSFTLVMGSSHIYEEYVDAALRMCVHTSEKTWTSYLSPDLPSWPLESLGEAELLARNGALPDEGAVGPIWKGYLEVLAHKTHRRDDLLVGNPLGEMMLRMKEVRRGKTNS